VASKKKRIPRCSGSKVRKHALQRLDSMYVGNKRGYSKKVGRNMLLALQRLTRRKRVPELDITPENIAEGGGKDRYFYHHQLPNNLYVVLGADWSVINILEHNNFKKR